MFNKHLFAKVGVCVLLGLNVAAYYFFWPNYRGGVAGEGKPPAQEKGETRLVPAELKKPTPAPAPPEKIAEDPIQQAVPLQIPQSAKKPEEEKKQDTDAEMISKLLQHINQQEKKDIPPLEAFQPIAPPEEFKKKAAPLLPEEKPLPLPPLKADPIGGDKKIPPPSDLALTSGKRPESPWHLNMEVIGKQTQLTARLRHPTLQKVLAEFLIVCDRVEMKSQEELQAVGNVAIAGAGLSVNCQRVTLHIQHGRLIFEEQVHVIHEASPSSTIRGERLFWEVTTPVRPN